MLTRRTVFVFIAAAFVCIISASGAHSETKLGPRTSNENGMLIVVTPKHVGPNDRIWEFDVSVDTHVKPLNEDITKNSSLIDSSGQHFKALKWEGTGPGGHHRKGTLQFLRPDPLPASVAVEIDGLGGSAKRNFSWKLK